MRLALTASDTRLGRALRVAAARAGHQVLAFGRPPFPAPTEGVRDSPVAIERVGSVRYLLRSFRADVLVHLAGPCLPTPHRAADREDLPLASKLFRTAYASGVQRVVGLGSYFEYRPGSSAYRESDECLPITTVGLLHQVTHGVLSAAAADSGRSYSWLRRFELIDREPGPPANGGRVAGAATPHDERRARHALRDVLTIEDASRAVLHAIEHELDGPVNLCQGAVGTAAELEQELRRAGVVDAAPWLDALGPPAVGMPTRLAESGFVPSARTMGELVEATVGGGAERRELLGAA